jgi:very-short-patch-repair endonuclease
MYYPKGKSKRIKDKAERQGFSEHVGNKRVLSSWASLAKKELRRKATPAELCFMSKLLDAGFIHHTFQKSFYKGSKLIIADFHIRKPKRIVIEIDGGYHMANEQLIKDLDKDRIYLGNTQCECVLRISNLQAFNMSVQELKKVIVGLRSGEVTCLYDR